ncbi:MAG: hypothetical protein ABJF10_25485 [Chthoniobacter sp.]|uniref:hypothetical protein n=1 Tax=Chthoniobacter sp. TaxID=2510640 RepID=UPI0032A30DD5
MAKVFIGIALLFMLVTAGVGFMLKGNVDKLQSALSSAKGKITVAEANARSAKSDAEKAQKEATEANGKAEAATQALATKTKEADESQTKLKEVTLVIDGKDKEIAALNEKLGKGPGGPDPAVLAQLQAQVADLTTQKANAEAKAAEQGQLYETAVAKGKDNEQKVAELTKKERERLTNFQKPGLQGRILAVNNGWNFVVLSVGDKQGVMTNSSLIVVRGNEPIARLRVTSVEPSTSIADVLPGTVRRGVSVQPGDTVIFEGTRGATPGTKAAPEAGLAAPLTPTPALPNN